jgi:ribosomal protein S18 acetylase RimI-like enzyme
MGGFFFLYQIEFKYFSKKVNVIMNDIIISKATIKDVAIVQNIGRQTFYETFAESNTEEDMAKYLDENFSAGKVSAELNNPDSEFFITWDEDEAIGYLKLNTGKAQTELQDETSLEIERIYVKSEYHGKKVGQILYDKALEVAIAHGKQSIWLGVWEENARAIKFYEKNGFVSFDKHIFKMGEDEQTDIMMRKQL